MELETVGTGSPPHDLEAEKAVLGALMEDADCAVDVFAILREDDFYSHAHRTIFRAMKSIHDQQSMPDFVVLSSHLRDTGVLAAVGGPAYLIELTSGSLSTAAQHHALIVQQKAILRELLGAGREIHRLVHDSSLTLEEKLRGAERAVFLAGERRLAGDLVRVGEIAETVWEQVTHVLEGGEPVRGLATGFADLDEIMGGAKPGELIIIAARPAMGKTALVMNIALNVALGVGADPSRPPGAVAVFSLEMTAVSLTQRLMASLSRVRPDRWLRPGLPNEECERVYHAAELLAQAPIYLDESADVSASEMVGKLRRLQSRVGPISLIVVDYLQLMRSSRRIENRAQEIGEIARSLKAMSKTFQCPVLALSQLNRQAENRDDKRPQLSDLRESGSIEAEADLVGLIYRDSYYHSEPDEFGQPIAKAEEVAELIIAKHRNGPTDTVLLAFEGAYTKFQNLDHSSQDSYRKSMREQSNERKRTKKG